MLRPVERQSLSSQVFRQIRDGILTEQYRPGDRLPSERDLCDILGINRGSVREALKRLEQARLIETRQGDGSVVQDFTRTAGFDLFSHLVMPGGRANPIVLRSIAELRQVIGAEVPRLAALRIQEPELARLKVILEKIEACPAQDVAAFQDLDFEFHYTMARAGGNLGFVLMYNSVRDIYRALQDHFAPMFTHAMENPGVHRQIYEAVAARDPEKAGSLCAAFIEQGNAAFWKKALETRDGHAA